MQTLQPNATLQGGKYRIIKILGQGGFGITYLVEHTLLKSNVAIKEFFMKDLCNRDEATSHVSVGSQGSRELVNRFRAKFIKEASRIANLHHQNIIRVIDIFEENGTAYYVMEYCQGGSLSAKLHQQYLTGLPIMKALKYIRQIASALDYVHQRKMNHLDVKPANIMLNEEEDAILIDFGLAKQYDAETGNQTSSTPVGISEGYAPMEQYKKGGVGTFSPSTDIYALSATLYKLITGQTPPGANDVFNEGLPALPSSIPGSIVKAITQGMQPRKMDRPQSIDAWLMLLNEVPIVIVDEQEQLRKEAEKKAEQERLRKERLGRIIEQLRKKAEEKAEQEQLHKEAEKNAEQEQNTLISVPTPDENPEPDRDLEMGSTPDPIPQSTQAKFNLISPGVKARHISCNILLGIIFIPLVFLAVISSFIFFEVDYSAFVLCLLTIIATYSLVLQNRRGGLWLGIIAMFSLLTMFFVQENYYEVRWKNIDEIDSAEIVYKSLIYPAIITVITVVPILLTLLIRKNGVSALKNLESKGVFFKLRYEIIVVLILCIVAIVMQIYELKLPRHLIK